MEEFNILVCDDDHSIVDAIEIYLKQDGYRVIKAYNGLEALKALEENEIHLIILDIMMPRLNGLDAARTIREMKRRDAMRVPIIAMSANAFAEDIINSQLAGMNAHLAKPLDAEKMIVALKQYMEDNRDIKLHEDL